MLAATCSEALANHSVFSGVAFRRAGVGSARSLLIERCDGGVAEQHAGAAAVVVDQHCMDEAAHDHQSPAPAAASTGEGCRSPPAAMVHDLDTDGRGFDPEGFS